jgi:hypothetical protein
VKVRADQFQLATIERPPALDTTEALAIALDMVLI